MSFENELQGRLQKWLAEQSRMISETILDGSCKDFAEYKERCGKLRALWETETEMRRATRRLNSLDNEGEEDGDTTTHFE